MLKLWSDKTKLNYTERAGGRTKKKKELTEGSLNNNKYIIYCIGKKRKEMLALQDRKNVECCFLLVVVAFCFARQRRPRARKLYGGRSQEGKRIKIILVLKKKEEEQASHFLPFFFLSDGPLVVDDFSYLEGSAVWNAPFLLCVMLSSCS